MNIDNSCPFGYSRYTVADYAVRGVEGYQPLMENGFSVEELSKIEEHLAECEFCRGLAVTAEAEYRRYFQPKKAKLMEELLKIIRNVTVGVNSRN